MSRFTHTILAAGIAGLLLSGCYHTGSSRGFVPSRTYTSTIHGASGSITKYTTTSSGRHSTTRVRTIRR